MGNLIRPLQKFDIDRTLIGTRVQTNVGCDEYCKGTYVEQVALNRVGSTGCIKARVVCDDDVDRFFDPKDLDCAPATYIDGHPAYIGDLVWLRTESDPVILTSADANPTYVAGVAKWSVTVSCKPSGRDYKLRVERTDLCWPVEESDLDEKLSDMWQALDREQQRVKDFLNENNFDCTSAPYALATRYRTELKALMQVLNANRGD